MSETKSTDDEEMAALKAELEKAKLKAQIAETEKASVVVQQVVYGKLTKGTGIPMEDWKADDWNSDMCGCCFPLGCQGCLMDCYLSSFTYGNIVDNYLPTLGGFEEEWFFSQGTKIIALHCLARGIVASNFALQCLVSAPILTKFREKYGIQDSGRVMGMAWPFPASGPMQDYLATWLCDSCIAAQVVKECRDRVAHPELCNINLPPGHVVVKDVK